MRTSPLILLVMLGVAGSALAQARPSERRPLPPVEGRQDARHESPQSPEEAKQLLNRGLEDLEQRRERIHAALRKIEEGVPLREAMRGIDLRPDRGFDRRADGGPGGLGGPPRLRGAEPGSLSEALGQPGARRMDHPPTPEQKARAKAFLRQHMPDVAARMEENERANPEGFERGMSRLIPRIEDTEAVREQDPKLFGLRVREIEGQIRVVEAIRSDREARESKDPARMEQAATALRSALTMQMDTRLELQDHEIEQLTQRVEELRADVQKKRTNRAAAIDEMLKRVRDFGERRARERQSDGRPPDGPQQPPSPRK